MILTIFTNQSWYKTVFAQWPEVSVFLWLIAGDSGGEGASPLARSTKKASHHC